MFTSCVANSISDFNNKYVLKERKWGNSLRYKWIVWKPHFGRAERNVTLIRGLNHSGSTNTSPSVTGCHLLSSLPHSVCEPTSSKKREKTTHQPGEGAIWGMWKVAIATKRRDKEIKAQNKPIIPLDKPKLQELAVPKPISLKSQSKSNLSLNKN